MLFVLWLLIPVFFWVMWYHLCGGRVLRHAGTLHFMIYFVAIYAMSYSIHADGYENEVFLCAIMAYPCLALVGAAIAGLVADTRPFDLRVSELRSNALERQIVKLLLLALTGLLLVYILILGRELPLYALLTEGAEAAKLARFVATKGYKEAIGDVGLIVSISRVFTDYFSLFVLVFMYCRAARGETSFRAVVITAVALIFATLLFGERYPVLKLLVFFALAVLALKRAALTWRLGAVLAGMGVLLVPIVGFIHALVNLSFVYLEGVGTLRLLVWSWEIFSGRAMGGQLAALQQTFTLVPASYDFFGGVTLSNPRDLLPYEQVQLPFLVYDSYLSSPPGVQGSDPTVFFGEVYANFGQAAMYVSMMLMGFVIQLTNAVIARRIQTERSIYFVALHFMVAVYVADFAISFTTIYFDYRFFFLVMLYVLPSAPFVLNFRRLRPA